MEIIILVPRWDTIKAETLLPSHGLHRVLQRRGEHVPVTLLRWHACQE